MDSQVTDLPVVVRTLHQEVIVTGPGRLLTEAYITGGRFIEKKVNRLAHKWGHGPYAAKKHILKQLKPHEGSAVKHAQFRNGVQISGKLEKACMAFMKYALPSESRAAQLKTFKFIVHLATRFPGLRHIFLRCKHIQAVGATKVCTVRLWIGDDNFDYAPDETWRFFVEFTASCIFDDERVAGILENSTLDDLGYIPVGTGEYSVIEQLLVASGSCDKFEPWVAIRYLGGILESPSFWHQDCHYNHKAVTEMLFGRVRQLVEDMDMEGWAKMDNTLRLRVFHGDVQGIDELVVVLLNGVGIWCQNDENHRLDPVRNNFTRLMELICHPAAGHLLPRSYNHASQEYTSLVGMRYQRDSVEIVELSNSPPSSPASTTHSQHFPTASLDIITAPGTEPHIMVDTAEGEVDGGDRNGMAWTQETREKAAREKEFKLKGLFRSIAFGVTGAPSRVHSSYTSQDSPFSPAIATQGPSPNQPNQASTDLNVVNTYASLPEGILLSADVGTFHYELEEYWFCIHAAFQPYGQPGQRKLPPAKHLILFRAYDDFYDLQVSLLETFPREAGRQSLHARILPYMPGPAVVVDDTLTATRRADLDEYLHKLCALNRTSAKYILEHQVVRDFLSLKPGDVENDTEARVQQMEPLFGHQQTDGAGDEYDREVRDTLGRMKVQDNDEKSNGASEYKGAPSPQRRAHDQDRHNDRQSNDTLRLQAHGQNHQEKSVASFHRTLSPQPSRSNSPLHIERNNSHSSATASKLKTPPIPAANPLTAFVKIKIFDQEADDIIAIRVRAQVTHTELMDKVQSRLGKVNNLRYRDGIANNFVTLDSDNLHFWMDSTDKHVLFVN